MTERAREHITDRCVQLMSYAAILTRINTHIEKDSDSLSLPQQAFEVVKEHASREHDSTVSDFVYKVHKGDVVAALSEVRDSVLKTVKDLTVDTFHAGRVMGIVQGTPSELLFDPKTISNWETNTQMAMFRTNHYLKLLISIFTGVGKRWDIGQHHHDMIASAIEGYINSRFEGTDSPGKQQGNPGPDGSADQKDEPVDDGSVVMQNPTFTPMSEIRVYRDAEQAMQQFLRHRKAKTGAVFFLVTGNSQEAPDTTIPSDDTPFGTWAGSMLVYSVIPKTLEGGSFSLLAPHGVIASKGMRRFYTEMIHSTLGVHTLVSNNGDSKIGREVKMIHQLYTLCPGVAEMENRAKKEREVLDAARQTTAPDML